MRAAAAPRIHRDRKRSASGESSRSILTLRPPASHLSCSTILSTTSSLASKITQIARSRKQKATMPQTLTFCCSTIETMRRHAVHRALGVPVTLRRASTRLQDATLPLPSLTNCKLSSVSRRLQSVIQVNCITILLALWCRCAHGSVLYPMLGVVYPMLDVFCTPAATRG